MRTSCHVVGAAGRGSLSGTCAGERSKTVVIGKTEAVVWGVITTSCYCPWIMDYTITDSALRAETLQEAPPVMQWTDNTHRTVVDLKTALVSAPALGLPDLHKAVPSVRVGVRWFHLWSPHAEAWIALSPGGVLLSWALEITMGMTWCRRSVGAFGLLIDRSALYWLMAL